MIMFFSGVLITLSSSLFKRGFQKVLFHWYLITNYQISLICLIFIQLFKCIGLTFSNLTDNFLVFLKTVVLTTDSIIFVIALLILFKLVELAYKLDPKFPFTLTITIVILVLTVSFQIVENFLRNSSFFKS